MHRASDRSMRLAERRMDGRHCATDTLSRRVRARGKVPLCHRGRWCHEENSAEPLPADFAHELGLLLQYETRTTRRPASNLCDAAPGSDRCGARLKGLVSRHDGDYHDQSWARTLPFIYSRCAASSGDACLKRHAPCHRSVVFPVLRAGAAAAGRGTVFPAWASL